MSNNSNRFIINNNDQFGYNKKNLDKDINFNRVAFIFFVFFIISIIYSIHLIHLGSNKSDLPNNNHIKITNKLHRADILDRNGSFLAKSVSSIDIGINPIEVIDQKKIIIKFKIYFS